jgi:hypothetical protein
LGSEIGGIPTLASLRGEIEGRDARIRAAGVAWMLGRMRCLGGGVQDSPHSAAKRVSPASWWVDTAAAEAPAGAGGKGLVVICFRPPDVMEMVHEVAIYIHCFHNLDLFQQG